MTPGRRDGETERRGDGERGPPPTHFAIARFRDCAISRLRDFAISRLRDFAISRFVSLNMNRAIANRAIAKWGAADLSVSPSLRHSVSPSPYISASVSQSKTQLLELLSQLGSSNQ